jgi:hypothetical protein
MVSPGCSFGGDVVEPPLLEDGRAVSEFRDSQRTWKFLSGKLIFRRYAQKVSSAINVERSQPSGSRKP